MFAIELGAPFLIFAPRRLRFFGGAAIAFLQILILLTGNYTFFNWLTLALCLLLLDDLVLMKFCRVNFQAFSGPRFTQLQPLALARGPSPFRLPLWSLAIYLLQINLASGSAPALALSRSRRGDLACAVSHRQQLRPVRRDDHRTA